jgi:hypothetical protein
MDRRRAGPLVPQQASQGSRCGLRFIASRGLEAQVTSNHPMFLPPSSLDYRTEPLVPATEPLVPATEPLVPATEPLVPAYLII